jgi:hypothetical protein
MVMNFGRAPKSVAGTVMGAAELAKAQSSKDRDVNGRKNVKATRVSKPSPTGTIRSMTGAIKGPDRGAG